MSVDAETSAPEGRAPVVLQVLPSLNTGGVERGTVDIAEAVVEAGGEALVASEGGRLAHELQRAGAEHIELPLASKNPLVMLRNIGRLRAVIRARGVDIVHARSRAPAWSALFACRGTGARFITTFHGTYNRSAPFKKLYNSVMTRGNPIIAISHFIADHIAGVYKVERRRIRVIHRGVDIGLFDPRQVPAARVINLAAQWRLPEDMRVIMLPGRLTRWKGHALLIEALARLDTEMVRCLIVGGEQGGGYRRELERLVGRLGLERIVQFVGDCTDMPAAYMLADVVVSASTDPEAFGRVMVEAQAMGKPVVAAHHGASAELVLRDETGWLFEPESVDSLATALDRAMRLQADQREQLAQRAIANVRANFTKELMCARTLEVYGEVLRDAAAARARVTARAGARAGA
ncbi:MAG: glycosyltransferase [Alphaproteobacteria bacterium]|nr:glycosyltransferase [Alphaproteobacteria bacterium]